MKKECMHVIHFLYVVFNVNANINISNTPASQWSARLPPWLVDRYACPMSPK